MGISGLEFSEAIRLDEYGEPSDAELSAIEYGETLDEGDISEMQDIYATPRESNLRVRPAKAGRAVVAKTNALAVRVLDENWQDGANCLGVDPDLFFPERGASLKEAKAVCRGCVVREDCLEFALQNREKFGIWGGLSERQRRSIRQERAQARRVVGA